MPITPSLVILLIVFVLIAIRQWLPSSIRIWHIMLAGAMLMILAHQVSIVEAVKLIQWDVIAFLFGVFSIGAGLQQTGLLQHLSQRLLNKPRSLSVIVFAFMLICGLAAALFTNDTVAIIATSIALLLARETQVPAKLFLFALCFSLTIGGALTPIGNPQNMLIAVQGNFLAPFTDFFIYTAVPVLFSFIICYAWLRFLFRHYFNDVTYQLALPVLKTKIDRWPVLLSVGCFIILLIYHGISQLVQVLPSLSLAWVGMIACLPMYIFSCHRLQVLRQTDWRTLVFFMAMFVVVCSVWHSGIIQQFIRHRQLDLRSNVNIFVIASLLSQVTSNVPLVELYLSYLGSNSMTHSLMALSLSSTLAGNLLIISAASTVIVIQQAEQEGDRSITFWNFFAIGLPLTMITLLISYAWVCLLQ